MRKANKNEYSDSSDELELLKRIEEIKKSSMTPDELSLSKKIDKIKKRNPNLNQSELLKKVKRSNTFDAIVGCAAISMGTIGTGKFAELAFSMVENIKFFQLGSWEPLFFATGFVISACATILLAPAVILTFRDRKNIQNKLQD